MARLKRNEWNFAAIAAARITELLRTPELASSQLGHAEPELSELRGARRLDLVIFDRRTPTHPLVTAELKTPWSAEGRTPYAAPLVEGAHSKASRVGARYFITWNIRRLVVWKTDEPGVALDQRVVYDNEVVNTPGLSEHDLDGSDVRSALDAGLRAALHFLSSALAGTPEPSFLPLDRLFISRLESALDYPVETAVHSLTERLSNTTFRVRCERWMRDDQGWIVSRATQSENIERAARFTSYVLVNRLCFYNTLKRKYALPRLTVANNVSTGQMLARRLHKAFNEAKRFTGDYETVFAEDFGDSIPFLSNEGVSGWRALIRSLDRYDFATLPLDIVGSMYEQLISPEERHRYGQHYTQPAVVDLINAFAVRDPDAKVLDPACGGGTFLVRAYARKQYLDRSQTHADLLDTLLGCDILQYACHLSVINLAVRDLIDDDNFPRVRFGDFLRFEPGRQFFEQPVRLQAGGLVTDHKSVVLDSASCDAVVGNPPYISARVLPPRDRAHYRAAARREWPDNNWSASSDIYCYFWTHAARFVREGGVLALVTQAAWLDVEYGVPVQEWMLRNFRIAAVLESEVEPWFTDARVATAVTVLVRDNDKGARDKNTVKFVQFRQRIADLAASCDTEAERHGFADRLRDALLAADTDTDTDAYRIRCVTQQTLLGIGTSNEEYTGSSWGRYLRSIQTLDELQRDHQDRFVALHDLARIGRGITTNCDDFFVVKDVTQEAIERTGPAQEFLSRFGVERDQADAGDVAIIRRADGFESALDTANLRPILRTARGLSHLSTSDLDLADLAVTLPEDRDALSDRAHAYVRAGEREHWHESPSFRGAIASGRSWFTLRHADPAPMLFVKTMQYNPFVIWNDAQLLANQRLYEVTPADDVSSEALCAVLNSTVFAAERYASVKALGREAAIDVEVFTARRFRVPNLRLAEPDLQRRLAATFRQLRRRQVGPLLENALRTARLKDAVRYTRSNLIDADCWPAEFHDSTRQRLDTLVLQLCGVPSDRIEAARDRLYNELLAHTRRLRVLELEAQENRQGASSGVPSAKALAQEIWSHSGIELRRVPSDFVSPTASHIHLPVGRVQIVPQSLFDQEHGFRCRIGNQELSFETDAQRDYVVLLAECGLTGDAPLPSAEVCRRVLPAMRAYVQNVRAQLTKAAADITSRNDLANRIVREALRVLVRQ